MAPPPAGERRVLIDPVVAAFVELDSVAFDGTPRDLGVIRFTRGSALTIHARTTPPFAPPSVLAVAERLDGIAYMRRSSLQESKEKPFDPVIRGLGPGRFRVTLHSSAGGARPTWTAEVTLDGVHDAELTILTD